MFRIAFLKVTQRMCNVHVLRQGNAKREEIDDLSKEDANISVYS